MSHGHSHGGQECHGHGGQPQRPKGSTLEDLNNMFDDDVKDRALIDPKAVAQDPTNLQQACECGRLSTVVLSFARGVDIKMADHEVGATPLHWAAYKGHLPIVKFLVDNGANPNCTDMRGQSPMMWAINELHFEVVQYLLDHGADPLLTDQRGCDAFSIAVQVGSLAMVHLLHLHKPLPAESKDNDGHNLLVWACYKGHLGVAEYLHDVHKVSLLGVDAQKRTALHWAAREGWIDVCVWLLQKGVDPKLTDADGMTPHGWAVAHHHYMLSRLLSSGKKETIVRVFGTLTGLTSNIFFLGHFLLGIVYVVALFALGTRWIPTFLCYSLCGSYMLKNFGIYSIIRTPIRNCRPVPNDLGMPSGSIETLRGTELLDYREPSIVSIVLSFLCVQYVALGLVDIEVPVLYYGLLLATALFAISVKMNAFADIVPRGTAAEDPVLRAVERKEFEDCRWNRIYRSKQHIRVPLRAFHCKEYDEVLYEYCGWSLLLDAPVSRSTRRSYVFFTLCLALLQAFVFYISFTALYGRYCPAEKSFSVLQFAWDMLISALPCKAPNDGSWFSFFIPESINRGGFWLLNVTGSFCLILLRSVYFDLSTASIGVTPLEAIHTTMPSTDGGLTPIMRNGYSIFANGSRLRTLLAFLTGSAGQQWRSTQAIPPPPRNK